MENCIIKYCAKCTPHEYQDQRYGFKMRVMNRQGKMDKSSKVRCTVCNAEHEEKSSERKK